MDADEDAPDALYVAHKIKMTFKRTGDDGVLGKCWKLVEVPLNFVRDYSVPMAEKAEWDRVRAAVIPFTLPWAFFFLQGLLTVGDDSTVHDESNEEHQ
jgi:hypothetical protein